MTDQPVTNKPAQQSKPGARNILIFSDGTGQRGGQYFDETRSNIYKLYRATRVAPDSCVNPDVQVGFYDPGLGTQLIDGPAVVRWWRSFYNFLSQATGLGITQNIIDCYAAIIRLWRPGDRIFLFGFSRGAYTVRCLSSVICLCGIPTTGYRGADLKLDPGSTKRIASRAVKTVYQHVSSPRDTKYKPQRDALAERFREDFSPVDSNKHNEPNTYPFFVGVFDTVASLSNYGSLGILVGAYAVLLFAGSKVLSLFYQDFLFWFGWILLVTACVLGAMYTYTHLKFAFRLKGYSWWETIHLTSFRQKFYDQNLNENVNYARHAISIDESRADFQRVPWGQKQSEWKVGIHKMDPMEQIWFAGNHADIGGGYEESEVRLSDIALTWMIEQAQHKKLSEEEKIVVDRTVCQLNPRYDGMQHDETQSSMFRFAGKIIRDPPHDATLHPTVRERFKREEVQQYNVMALYRPEALRNHDDLKTLYANIPQPHMTCWQRIKKLIKKFTSWTTSTAPIGANQMDTSTHTYSRVVSCVALLLWAILTAAAGWIIGEQCVRWLVTAEWHKMPLRILYEPHSNWRGLQVVLDWLFSLPLAFALFALGLIVFKLFGMASNRLYQWEARRSGKVATPSQTTT